MRWRLTYSSEEKIQPNISRLIQYWICDWRRRKTRREDGQEMVVIWSIGIGGRAGDGKGGRGRGVDRRFGICRQDKVLRRRG